jgi:hypothetical protein
LEKIQGKHEQKEEGKFILPSVIAYAAVSVTAEMRLAPRDFPDQTN